MAGIEKEYFTLEEVESCWDMPRRDGDLVIYDNRATMHRATRYDDANQRRELRRVTTLDIAEVPIIVAAE